jgi:hypothetical protein
MLSTQLKSSPCQLQAIASLLIKSDLSADMILEQNPELEKLLFNCLDETLDLAYGQSDVEAEQVLQHLLHEIISLRISPPQRCSQELSVILFKIEQKISTLWLKREIERVQSETVDVPRNADEFVAWFNKRCQNHPATNHRLFDFLAETATREDLRFFMYQECSVDPRFDDMLALAQVGVSGQPKLEFFHNFSDELGHGNPHLVHTTMFNELLTYLDIKKVRDDELLWQSLACGNLMSILCLYRVYYYLCIGYLGATEALAPSRFAKLIRGAKRLGIPEERLVYHLEHTSVDEDHIQGWLANIIKPEIVNNPEATVEIAQGVLLRLNISEAYCDAVLAVLESQLLAVTQA